MSNVFVVLGALALILAAVARRRSPRLVRPLTYGGGALVLAALVWALAGEGGEDFRRGWADGFLPSVGEEPASE